MYAHESRTMHHIRAVATLRRCILGCLAVVAGLCAVPGQAGAQGVRQTSTLRQHKSVHRVIRRWVPHIGRVIIPTRIAAFGAQIATWYGPGFYGHGTACGGTLTPGTWGIAHRTLPCGSLVTLTSHGRTVTVPVIDRGPYSGATVDLTSRTRSYLGFVSGTVRMTRVTRYRVVPNRVAVHRVIPQH